MSHSKINNARIAFAFLFGAALMVYAFYGWYKEEIDDWQAIIVGLIGFVFMYIPDKLQEIVSKGLGKVFSLTIGRFFGNSSKSTEK